MDSSTAKWTYHQPDTPNLGVLGPILITTPVSWTSVLCKILEFVIRDAVVTHIEQQNFYAHCQHGFMKRRSTLSHSVFLCIDCHAFINLDLTDVSNVSYR